MTTKIGCVSTIFKRCVSNLLILIHLTMIDELDIMRDFSEGKIASIVTNEIPQLNYEPPPPPTPPTLPTPPTPSTGENTTTGESKLLCA